MYAVIGWQEPSEQSGVKSSHMHVATTTSRNFHNSVRNINKFKQT